MRDEDEHEEWRRRMTTMTDTNCDAGDETRMGGGDDSFGGGLWPGAGSLLRGDGRAIAYEICHPCQRK
jgi:hypothetical protein